MGNVGLSTCVSVPESKNALELTLPASDALIKNRRNEWIQIAGHAGSFAPAGPRTIWKKRLVKDNTETKVYQALMDDVSADVVPAFFREVEFNGDYFIELEDLLHHFHNPSIMDIKMGLRTFLESEVKNPVRRKDLYEKLVVLDPNAPTPDEHEERAVTKLRYMEFREKDSSTSSLGFRVEAIRMSGEIPRRDLRRIRERHEVVDVVGSFIQMKESIKIPLLNRLKEIRDKLQRSEFFKYREIIGSSLLILYDQDDNVGAWMIDFAKTMPVSQPLNHRSPWVLGNHEDGYLHGMDNLIAIIEELEMNP
ncbi:inositol-trisphosphate 3-kinase homolog isoform X2 [Tubulanus polymorphus]|uniref:inositol-trisphosphate 3-kinase homolog isoform X2 n=1 Tax=Tubulanus polymorphus TaxID=672921 RepID=UPI003DA35948